MWSMECGVWTKLKVHQWVTGSENPVALLLSRLFHCKIPKQRVHLYFPLLDSSCSPHHEYSNMLLSFLKCHCCP
ncbi:hypothetical protein AQUCO_00300028v1 [Aquilegia coerulea]|uniref:Uncharacterized protein n=1 Tax=Aquilegia coerulea TaxID=218851 RepID=A0A2G5EWZ2_AQUCA|nr:hypothetical protein AQUCO_00300028v1 [Aquilegia coerulea]